MSADTIVGAKAHRIFAGTYCRLMAFELELNKNNFKLEEFWKTSGLNYQRRFRNSCGTQSKSTDYHLHLTWAAFKHHIVLTMEFAYGYKQPETDEKQPLAEDFIKWIRPFMLVNEIKADIHSDFDFPNESGRRVKFPLPLKAPVGPKEVEVEIDGISFQLSPPLGGVQKVWLTQGEKKLSVHLHAERIIYFDSFDPHNDVLAISGVLESMFEVKQLELDANK